MDFRPLAPDGPVVMIPKIWSDARGYFFESFRLNEFRSHCGDYEFVQDNQSRSSRGVLRGLHYQLNHPQGKLVRVVAGRVFDTAVDLRKTSPTFGKSFGVILDDIEHCSFWVPPGFAHGFMVLSDVAVFAYKCTAYYDPHDEHCLAWNDPACAVQWPMTEVKPILSARDQQGLPFAETALFP